MNVMAKYFSCILLLTSSMSFAQDKSGDIILDAMRDELDRFWSSALAAFKVAVEQREEGES